MALDAGLLELLRHDLAETSDVIEKKMFGGVSMILNGHMLCGVHKNGGMYRVGKDNYGAALAVNGARPATFTGRPMGGMVTVDAVAMGDDATRHRLLALACNFVQSLPPKA